MYLPITLYYQLFVIILTTKVLSYDFPKIHIIVCYTWANKKS